MPKLLLIHGFEGSSKGNWFPWLEKNAKRMGYEVLSSDWPDADHPDEKKVLPFLEEVTKDFGPNDGIIGHSLGAYWACRIAEKRSLGTLILVAPAIGILPFEQSRKDWGDSDIDALECTITKGVTLENIRAKKKVVFYSKDDPVIPLQNMMMFDETWEKNLLDKKGHFGQKDFPEILLVMPIYTMPNPPETNTGFQIDEELLWKEEIPVEEIPLEDLAHNLDILYLESIGTDHWNLSPRMLLENFELEIPHATKVNNADMSYPIELYFFKGQWIILDGVHRFTKAHLLHQSTIQVRRVSDEIVQRTKRSDLEYLRWQGIDV